MASCVVNRDRERPQGSRQVKIKQREGDLDCLPRLLCRDPGAHRDVRRYSLFFFWLIHSRPANQQFLVYGDASCSQLPRRQEAFLQRTSSSRGRGCHIAHGCGLRLEITSLCSRFAFKLQRPDEAGEDRRSCLYIIHIIVEHDQAELKSKKLETTDSSSLHVDLRGQPSNTQVRAGWLWQWRSSGSEAQLLFPALEKYRLAYRICV